jgi:translation initiation factor 3 subunit A
LAKYNVVQHVFPEVKDLYKWLEVEFHPLKLSERVTKCLDFIESKPDLKSENYAQYVPALKEILVTRLVKQVSQIYTTIEIKRFVRLAPADIPVFALEKIIVDAAKQLDLQVRINHQSRSLHFGNDLYVAQKEDLPEGPSIQSMPSEQIRNQLITMSESLQQAQELIYAHENRVKREELSQTIAHIYRQTCEKHHGDLLRRKQMIEDLKVIKNDLEKRSLS